MFAVRNGPASVLVRLDTSVTARGITSPFVLLHLSFLGDTWTRKGVVHVEIVGMAPVYQPTARPGAERFIGRNARYERV
jgi:hypothetical protein